jgi:PHD/YefM family antitoxin component YafN of YafNO toxin-antitoxin module
MKNVTSAEFQRNFGLWKRKALIEPVSILVHGHPSVVLLSTASYNALLKLASREEASISDVSLDVDVPGIEHSPSEFEVEELQDPVSEETAEVEISLEEIDETDVEALKRLMMSDR